MPELGRPVSLRERAFGQVKMAKKVTQDEVERRQREQLLEKVGALRDQSIYDQKDKTKMGKDEFLKLLTHQLANQDPMNPMDQGKMGAELAQFSQLEQLANLNSKFEVFQRDKAIQDKFYAASFIGKKVVTNGRSVKYNGKGTKSDVLFNLSSDAAKVLVRLHDSKGNIVAEQWKENIGRGNQNITWDGKRLDGGSAAEGQYNVKVFAWDDTAQPVEVNTKVVGEVESVFIENGEPILMVNGNKVPLRDVDSFHVPKVDVAQNMKAAQATAANPLKEQLDKIQNNINKNPANVSSNNFPIAQSDKPSVNLNKTNRSNAMKAYGNNELTTGLTNVYDVE